MDTEAKNIIEEQDKNPNEFVFLQSGLSKNIRTIITLKDDNIIIRKIKIDDEKKTETPKGEPTIVPRAAIGSISIKRTFLPLNLLGNMVAGFVIGFFIFGGLIVFSIFTLLGLVISFPKKMILTRKDGIKFKTVMDESEEYERLIKTLFK